MNCPISVVDVGSTRVAQAHNSSIWRGDSRPVPPFRSNRTSASMPPSWNSLIQMRMVESSTKRTLATSSKLIPRSSSRMAFARRETRFSSSPSLVIATRSARSAALRKLRLVFTRRLESIPLIRSNDFRKNEESRYIPMTGATSVAAEIVDPEGAYSLAGASAPTLAQPGYYVPTTGASSETPVSPGYYQPHAGATKELVALPPVIKGTVPGQSTGSGEPDTPFGSVTIADPNTDTTDSLSIQLRGGGGTLADGAGFTGLT